jgi:hypothetical protein
MTSPAQPPAAPTTPNPATPASAGAVTDLRRRLEALEAANQKLRRQAMSVLVITSVLLGLAAALVITASRHGMPGFVPSVVEAREFLLRDKDGRVRGAWGQDDEGAIRLVLQDHQSRRSIKLNLLEDGTSGLTFADSSGSARLIMAMLPDGTANLVFADHRGITRTVLGLNANGGSTLVFADGGGTTRSGIGVDRRGQAMLLTAGSGEPEAEPAAESVVVPPVDSVKPKRAKRAPAAPPEKP